MKPFVIGDSPSDLSPRRSFAQWHQLVEGTSDPWTAADFAAARMVRQSVADIVLQFRAVRTLIVQDQLQQFSQHVRASEQPVIIADVNGQVLLMNPAFRAFLPPDHPADISVKDLADVFEERDDFLQGIDTLLKRHAAWRAELRLRREGNRETSLLVRADPVQPSKHRLLGFVLIFSDMSERKIADAARRRFQEEIVRSHRTNGTRLNSETDLVYQNLLSSLVENAQLAALEITYGIETSRIAEMLEGVQSSTLRTAEVLEHLIVHSSRAAERGPSGI